MKLLGLNSMWKDPNNSNTVGPTAMPIVGAPVIEEATEREEHHCDTLFMCIVTTLNEGLRNGGGIGDILRKPSKDVRANLRCQVCKI